MAKNCMQTVPSLQQTQKRRVCNADVRIYETCKMHS